MSGTSEASRLPLEVSLASNDKTLDAGAFGFWKSMALHQQSARMKSGEAARQSERFGGGVRDGASPGGGVVNSVGCSYRPLSTSMRPRPGVPGRVGLTQDLGSSANDGFSV